MDNIIYFILTATLNNVIILNKLSDFENQLPSSKRKQLKEIANLVCGIKLYSYNMNQRTCNEEIFDSRYLSTKIIYKKYLNSYLSVICLVIDTLPNTIDILLQNIDQELEKSYKKILIITSWICQCYKVEHDLKAPLFVVRTRLVTIRSDELDKFKVVLVFYLQYKTNLEYINAIIYLYIIYVPNKLYLINA